MNITNKIASILLIALSIILYSCNTTEPGDSAELKLTVEDISCTEAWLKLTASGISSQSVIEIKADDRLVKQVSITGTSIDSIVYIDSLLPNKEYRFSASNGKGNAAETSARTLDTTSHDFTWETLTFGEAGAGSSTLYDVAIIDKNNIWVVGEIYTEDSYTWDSLGNWIDPYNAVHWNGNEWELVRIYYNYNESNIWSPIRTILAFNSSDIWFGSMHWNGVNFNMEPMNIDIPYQINRMWGRNSNDFYIVGNSGSIAHYKNGSWTKIESGTDVDLQDISGTPDFNEIWTCGWNYNNGRVSLLRIDKNNVESIWDSQTNTTLNTYMGTLNSMYANGNKEFVLAGRQIFRHSLVDKSQVKYEWVKTSNGSKVLEPGNYVYRIKGSSKNNIAIAGDAAMIWHFNGATWYKYSELYNLDDRLYGLAVTDNVIVAVGKRYSPGTLGGALLLIGRR